MSEATRGGGRPMWRCLARGRFIAGTALSGILGVTGVAGSALAQPATYDVVIDSVVTTPFDMDIYHSGGGTMLVEKNGAISVTSNTENAVSTGAGNPWTFQIDGTIRADGRGGGIASHADDTILVGTKGVIESLVGGSPIYSVGGVTVENAGRIAGSEFSIFLPSGDLSVTNKAGASIEGTVQMGTAATSTIDNSGSMQGLKQRSALYLLGDATIYNRQGATMASDSTVVDVYSGFGTLENAGAITSANAVNYATAGVRFFQSGTVTNAQTGRISAGYGVWLGNGSAMVSDKATLTNSGAITGVAGHGVVFWELDEASLTNTATGTLEGASVGAYFLGVKNGDVTNAGTIRGSYGLYLKHDSLAPTGHVSITNSGTIEGTGSYALAKTSGVSYDLTLDTGSNLIGKVMADSGDTLTLKGTGSEDEDLKGFGALTMAGSEWTLSGGVQADTLDLTSGVLTLNGADISFGSIDIANAAKLVVNGSFSTPAAMTLAGGARLGGTGTVGATTVNAGGILSPGNSIGTLNVTGDATFNAGSVYEVEVDPAGTASDRTIATGAVVINGGTVQQIGLAGSYSPTATYRILEGGTGLTGSFDSVISDYAFLDASLAYDRDNYTVDLTLSRNDISFADKVSTANQRATATATEAAGLGNPVFDAAAVLPDNAAVLGAAFDSLSGEVHASLQSSLVEGAGVLRNAVNNRMRSAEAGGAAPEVPVLGYAATADTPTDAVLAGNAPALADRWAVWGEGFGFWNRTDGNGNVASVDANTGGFLIGADVAALEATRVGVFAGYGRTDVDVSGRGSSATADSYHLGAYGVSAFDAGAGLLSLRGGASYSWNDIESDRTVAVGSLTGTPTASYSAGTAQVFGEAGWGFDVGSGVMEPFAGLAWVGLDTDGFTENGSAAALTGQSQDMSTLFSTLGARGSTNVELGTMPLELSGALGWRHAFGDVTPLTTASFAGGAPFTVAGAPIARNAALLEAGASFSLTDNAKLSFGYEGQFGEDTREQSLNLRLSARF